MVNVAKTTRRIYPHELDPKVRGHHRPDGRARPRTRPGSRSTRSPTPTRPGPRALADMDDTMDELTKSLFRHILVAGAPPTRPTVQQAVQVALVARHYERIADHAVTIAERVAVHGDRRRTPAPEDDAGDGSRRSGGRPRRSRGPSRGSGARARRHASTRSRLRRNCGSWGGSSWSRASARWRNSSISRRVAEHAVDLPVRGDRAEVDDPDVSLRGKLLELFGFLGHAGLRERDPVPVPGPPRPESAARASARGPGARREGHLDRLLRCRRGSMTTSTLSPGLVLAHDRLRRPASVAHGLAADWKRSRRRS